MEPDTVAPMIVIITGILATAGVILLLPVTRQLAAYLRMLTQQKPAPAAAPDATRVQEALARIEDRLRLLEERQQFSEELLRTRELRAREPLSLAGREEVDS